jgi:hypothetical protein
LKIIDIIRIDHDIIDRNCRSHNAQRRSGANIFKHPICPGCSKYRDIISVKEGTYFELVIKTNGILLIEIIRKTIIDGKQITVLSE